MAIADGLSTLATRLLTSQFAEDFKDCRPLVGNLVPVSGHMTDVMVSGGMAMALRCDHRFWAQREGYGKLNGECNYGAKASGARQVKGVTRVVMLLREKKEDSEVQEGSASLLIAAQDMRSRSWRKLLESEMYGAIVQARLEELERGSFGAKHLKMGRSQRRALERAMRRYMMADGIEPKLFFG